MATLPPAITLQAFEACTIPLGDWNHRAHLTIAWTLLRDLPFDQAADCMRRGVQRYNAARGIQTTATSGYHETLTLAWLRIVHVTMAVYGAEGSADAFLSAHPHLQSKVLLRLYYSRPRIMSAQARAAWVEPDLAPLPAVPVTRAGCTPPGR